MTPEQIRELSKTLKPCPFCGASATLWFTNDNHHSPYVECDGAIQTNRTKSCFACQCPWRFKTVEDAIAAWNRRDGELISDVAEERKNEQRNTF